MTRDKRAQRFQAPREPTRSSRKLEESPQTAELPQQENTEVSLSDLIEREKWN